MGLMGNYSNVSKGLDLFKVNNFTYCIIVYVFEIRLKWLTLKR